MSAASLENYGFQKVVVVLGVALMAVKFSAWALTGSVAILTDAMESIVNVAAGFIGLYALYLSAKPRDKEHPFGHGRVEVISSSIEGTMIAVAGILIIIEAADNLLHPKEISDLGVGIFLVAAAAVANYAVGRAAVAKGRKNRSQALVASGKHLCSDTYSSVGIIAGLLIVYAAMSAGYDARWLDSCIALLFGGIIIYTGARVVKDSMDTIMDKADSELISHVVACLNCHRHDHWIDIHNLRIIKHGSTLMIDMHVTLPKTMTVEQQSREMKEVLQAIEERFGDSVELSMNAEPCHEFSCCNCSIDCQERREPFVGHVRWTVQSLSQCCPHAVCRRVIRIHDPEDER
ncbi:MAG: cation diffusion facilitator family transporter [Candidatus Methanomethylophilaceae archaeon]|jgi:cation diffusion facilitator family transporter|nr:cation diffusion facilitator family transporter [Candidatus Methanomethylophilaceae archaeon]